MGRSRGRPPKEAPGVSPALIAQSCQRLEEWESIVSALPEPWQAAARHVEETGIDGRPLGLESAIFVARAFCDWYRGEDSDSLFTRRDLITFRRRVEQFLAIAPRRAGRPRRGTLSGEDIASVKAEYQAELKARRDARRPAGDEGRKEIVKRLAAKHGIGDWKYLWNSLFSRPSTSTRTSTSSFRRLTIAKLTRRR